MPSIVLVRMNSNPYNIWLPVMYQVQGMASFCLVAKKHPRFCHVHVYNLNYKPFRSLGTMWLCTTGMYVCVSDHLRVQLAISHQPVRQAGQGDGPARIHSRLPHLLLQTLAFTRLLTAPLIHRPLHRAVQKPVCDTRETHAVIKPVYLACRSVLLKHDIYSSNILSLSISMCSCVGLFNHFGAFTELRHTLCRLNKSH